MTSHLLLMVLFSLMVAVVFAFLMKDDARERLRFGAVVFGSQWSTTVGFALMILVLVVRPSGLVGRRGPCTNR